MQHDWKIETACAPAPHAPAPDLPDTWEALAIAASDLKCAADRIHTAHQLHREPDPDAFTDARNAAHEALRALERR